MLSPEGSVGCGARDEVPQLRKTKERERERERATLNTTTQPALRTKLRAPTTHHRNPASPQRHPRTTLPQPQDQHNPATHKHRGGLRRYTQVAPKPTGPSTTEHSTATIPNPRPNACRPNSGWTLQTQTLAVLTIARRQRAIGSPKHPR